MMDPRPMGVRVKDALKEGALNTRHHLAHIRVAALQGEAVPKGSLVYLLILALIALAIVGCLAMSALSAVQVAGWYLSGWDFECWRYGPRMASIAAYFNRGMACFAVLACVAGLDTLPSDRQNRYRGPKEREEARGVLRATLARLEERQALDEASILARERSQSAKRL